MAINYYEDTAFISSKIQLYRDQIFYGGRPSDPPVSTSYKCSVFKIPVTEDFNSPYSSRLKCRSDNDGTNST